MMQDLKEEYLDTPTEVSAGSRAQQILSKAQKEKQDYEEAYLTRLPITKTEKHRQRRLTTLGKFLNLFSTSNQTLSKSKLFAGTLGDEITSFADISALEGRSSSAGGGLKRKRKSAPSKKGKGGKKRKFH